MAMTEKGALYTWDLNNYLQLSHCYDQCFSTHKQTGMDAQHFDVDKVIAVSAGHVMLSALTLHRALYTWRLAYYEGDGYAGERPTAKSGLGHVIEGQPTDTRLDPRGAHKTSPTQIDLQLMDGACVG